MRPDPGLQDAVTRFIERLTAVLDDVSGEIPGVDPEGLRRDVTTEAYNLAAGFIDADGLQTDPELWSFIATFGADYEYLLGSTPDQLRRTGALAGTSAWLASPSTLLGLLVDVDARAGTGHARAYYEEAMDIAHTVASLDTHVSRTELQAIEAFRTRTLNEMDRAVVTGATPGDRGNAEEPDDATPGEAGDELPPPRPLDELLAEMDALVGLRSVKEEVHLVADLLRVQELRKDRGLPVLDQSRHLVFVGNPGTGKTTVARLLAQIYRTLGVVARGHLVETDRSALVAGFVGQTATKVVAVFDQADEGVLLIDEAYALARGSSEDFGREAIDTLVKLVEDRRDRIVVVVAGYPEEMTTFIDTNPGLRSRFPKTIHFPDYDTDELVRIFGFLTDKGGYLPDDDATARVRAWFEAQARGKGFGNGRLARNLFEDAVARQARRVVVVTDPTDQQLVALTGDDIPDPPSSPPTGADGQEASLGPR